MTASPLADALRLSAVAPRRPGYCYGYRINYRHEQNGRITRCQDGERIYASKADAETDAAYARRHADSELDRLYGPQIVEVCEVLTSPNSLKRGAIHPNRSEAA